MKLPLVAVVALRLLGRSPCGERGLKYHRVGARFQCLLVAPRAGSVD